MSEFKVLSERDHIRKRPAMYIGAVSPTEVSGIINFQYQTKTIVPGLIKIIEEVYQNSIDEFIRTDGKFANELSVEIDEVGLDGWFVTITDNGRGIPVKEYDGVYQAELAWTRARAGTNFGDDNERTTIGMNGVGSFATNCFSTEFIGKSGDGKNTVTVHSVNGGETTTTTVKKSKYQGTSVTFYPDLSQFGIIEISEDHLVWIEDSLTNLMLCYPGLNIRFNKKKLQIKNTTQLAKSFHENAIHFKSDNDCATVVIAPTGDDEEFRHMSYINGINIKNGGSHIDYIVSSITQELIPAIKRKWKIDVLPNQIKQHLIVAAWVHSFPNPKFDSQSKERLTNTNGEVKSFIEFDAKKVATKLINTEDIIKPMIEAILHKKELADKRAAAAAMKKVRKKKIAGHLQATDANPLNRTLFIAEGLSALSALITVRNPKAHGGYALRGKVLNTHDMKHVDILNNKELAELTSILGLDLSNKSTDDIEYGKISILTDMDVDGISIACLLLQYFSRWPKLFEEGRITRLESPLFIARKKGQETQYFYTFDEYEANRNKLKGYEIDYIKGLGSLTNEDYKYAIDNPRETVIKLDTLDKLNMAFGNDSNARKEWILNAK